MTNPCSKCKWMRDPGEFAQCIAPQNMVEKHDRAEPPETSFPVKVQIRIKPRWYYCSTHRNSDWLSALMGRACGRSGRWFEAAEDTL